MRKRVTDRDDTSRAEAAEIAAMLPLAKRRQASKGDAAPEPDAWLKGDEFLEFDGDAEAEEERLAEGIREILGVGEEEMTLLLSGPGMRETIEDEIASRFGINPGLLKGTYPQPLARLLESKRILDASQTRWLEMRMRGN
jgi:hypothetical protein